MFLPLFLHFRKCHILFVSLKSLSPLSNSIMLIRGEQKTEITDKTEPKKTEPKQKPTVQFFNNRKFLFGFRITIFNNRKKPKRNEKKHIFLCLSLSV
ncbi:hypothetical protein HanIR_Chr04g0196951 [Helianthus annuus]|nr:hypothetical protein HanIR_Chr04g0196951 [Helianthus annuus]